MLTKFDRMVENQKSWLVCVVLDSSYDLLNFVWRCVVKKYLNLIAWNHFGIESCAKLEIRNFLTNQKTDSFRLRYFVQTDNR